MFEKKFTRPPTSLVRSGRLSDLQFVCQDGFASAHQFVLEKHSPFLKKFFTSQYNLVGVTLNQPRVKGLPPTLKERREPSPLIQIHLPDYKMQTVDLLLDLLYMGKTAQLGEMDQSRGQLSIRVLYEDLGFDPECGGLPDIAELDTIEVERVKQVVVNEVELKELEVVEEVQELCSIDKVEPVEEVKEVPSIEIATSTTVDLDGGAAVDDIKIVDSPVYAQVDMISSDNTAVKETENQKTMKGNDELLDVDVSDLMSDEEVVLDDFDYETYGENVDLMDLSVSPVIDDTQCLKEFSKVRLGTKTEVIEEPFEEKEKDFIEEVETYGWEMEELGTNFENASKLSSQGRRSSLNLVKKTKMEKQAGKTGKDGPVADQDLPTSSKNKKELKLSVFGNKRKKRRSSNDDDYLPPIKIRKNVKTQKNMTRSKSSDGKEKIYQNETPNTCTNKNLSKDAGNVINMKDVSSSDELKPTESIADCFQKLCDTKLEEVEFSCPAMSPEIKISIQTPLEVPRLSIKNIKETVVPSLSNYKQTKKSAETHTKKSKESKIQKPTPVVIKLSDTSNEFSCPIQSCPQKHAYFTEKIHPKIYRVLKHLISHHLRKEPCGIYRDLGREFCTGEVKCSSPDCTYATESKTSLLTHLAYEHGDLFNRIKSYRRKAESKEEVDIYFSIDQFLKREWQDWKPSASQVSSAVCSVNLTVKDCQPCDEMFLSWGELRIHILAKHCLHQLDLYISGSEEAGFECEASHDCSVKVGDKISILNHLASKDHSIISDKEIVDIALGVKEESKEIKSPSNCQDLNRPDSALSIVIPKEVPKDTPGSKSDVKGPSNRKGVKGKSQLDFKQPGSSMGVEITTEVSKSSMKGLAKYKAKDIMKRKSRDESFEIFGSPLQILQDAPVKGKRLENVSVKKPCITDFVPVTCNVESKTTLQAELLNKEIPLKKYQCKFCVHNYVDDDDLREHLIEEHQDRFKPIQLLEGGEKFYECFLCFKRTKMKAFHMKHLKTQHKEITLDLVKSVEQWKLKVISFMDFCIERDESFDYMLRPTTWESKPEQLEISSRLKLHSRLDNSPVRSPETKHFVPIPVTEIDDASPSIEIETLGDDSFDSLDCILEDDQKEDTHEIVMPEEIENKEADFIETVKIEPFVNLTSSPKFDVGIDVSSDEEVIEEYVSITKRRPPKVKLKVRAPLEFVCKVCDKMFPSGFKVSAHVFMFHLQRMSDMVWQELYIRHKDTNSLVCLLCGEAHERARLAKLHQYSEHKRELKKKMEEKGQDWRNLLDYIQYKVTEEMINEEDVTESEVESRSCSTSEVYNNPFYLATNLSDMMIPQPDVTQTNPPSSPLPEVALQEPHSTSPLPEPPSSESPLPVKSSIDHIKIAVVTRKVLVKPCEDESDSDDGVQVCMESRDVCLKKVEALSKGDKTPKEKKNEIIQPDSIFRRDMLCPFPKCNELFLESSTLVDHYTASHPQSPLKLYLIRTLAPTRFYLSSSNKLSLILLSEEKMLFSCPQCEVQFTELQLQARHVARHSDSAVAQCEHCRNFVQVGDPLQQHQAVCLHMGELKRIGDLKSPENMSESNPSTSVMTSSVSSAEENSKVQLKLKPCTHRHGGCKEVFPCKKELHDHARKCRHRPNTSFACKHAGCTKRYYYKEDYDKHVARLHPNSAEFDPTPSTSSSEAVSTDTLPSCEEGSTDHSTP